ncbi:short-chain dehydrogenase [Nocardia seriolae]|uniref:Short-chain dehydrogenase n=2 Tax=Nocardia seriolae TaxID=37332 RepID=A0ABC9YQN5_9NOCA|nr:SDR family oxidoreductase [Nocardia seriolae]GAM45718.1 short-chain dehydrogenase [Nocardia seriolae]GAP27742.1 short-chain dehydrogenase [Nocardia seriolae]
MPPAHGWLKTMTNKGITEQSSRVVVVGGGSGMGQAIADALLTHGHEVIIVGRSEQRLADAVRELGDGKLSAVAADITDEDQVSRLFETVGTVDHVISTAADLAGAYGPIATFDFEHGRGFIETKLIGSMLLAKHARLTENGSLTYISGIAAYRPAVGGAMVASVNAALEGLVRARAVELAPIRVNAVSPGWVMTGIWDQMPWEDKDERLAAMAEKLPARRLGKPEDIAAAVLSLLGSEFVTGTVLHVDGGHRLV